MEHADPPLPTHGVHGPFILPKLASQLHHKADQLNMLPFYSLSLAAFHAVHDFPVLCDGSPADESAMQEAAYSGQHDKEVAGTTLWA
ncbi:hypothetical protein BaRGS_00012251 [Batillaria attramentaria]|uniref:Uncharacterized protein n=1 Tax=Batillaria attramentaria TaxID=370345 RepID=A0ABD0LBR2_9CAEN